MSNIQSAIKTYVCGLCDYSQDTDPENPWQQSPDMFPNVPLGKCPACYGLGIKNSLEHSFNSSRMAVIEVASDAELESRFVEEMDEHGQPVMIQTGERYELRVNQQTGQIYSEAVPVYEPKMRELTAQEIAELKEQRDQSLRELERIAV